MIRKYGLIVVLFSLSFSTRSFADTYIDICNRGAIGRLIANATQAPDCSHVSQEAMAALQDLYLSNFQLKKIPTDAFQGLSFLSRLDLNDNQISLIRPNAFQGLSVLRDLYLSGNQVRSISRSYVALPNSTNVTGIIIKP